MAASARRLRWPSLRWFAAPVWLALTGATLLMVVDLYDNASRLPRAEAWIAFAALWLTGEWLLAVWPQQGWALRPFALRMLHTVRTAGPWLMIWPVVAYLIGRWLAERYGDGTLRFTAWQSVLLPNVATAQASALMGELVWPRLPAIPLMDASRITRPLSRRVPLSSRAQCGGLQG